MDASQGSAAAAEPSATPSSSPDPPEGALAWASTHWIPPKTEVDTLTRERLPGAAGARRYWRLRDASGQSRILMWALPEDPAILPPALRRESGSGSIPFLEVAEFLARWRVPVPEIHAFDPERRFVLLEDLGGVHLADLDGTSRERAHQAAIALLARVHGIGAPDGPPPLPFRRHFDAEWIRFELGLFVALDWTGATRDALRAALDDLVAHMMALPRVLSLRDYQSQNLMIDSAGRLRVLDFQDALLAPAGLDLAALLFDSYVDLDRAERRRLLELYALLAPRPVQVAELAVLAVQRKAKDLSRFHRLVHVKGDARYVPSLGRAATSIREACGDLPPELASVARAFERALAELAP